MTDPLRAPGKTPRRAEALQPDVPGSGNDHVDADVDQSTGESPDGADEATAKQLEQTKTALDNVRHP